MRIILETVVHLSPSDTPPQSKWRGVILQSKSDVMKKGKEEEEEKKGGVRGGRGGESGDV